MTSSLYDTLNRFIKKKYYRSVFLKSSISVISIHHVRLEITEKRAVVSPRRGGKIYF